MDQAPQLLDALAFSVAHCRAIAVEHGTLLASLFLVGLVGSASHCVGMCGPFVLGQVGARLEAVPAARMSELRRLTGAALLPYHLGRMTTYVGLGAVAGGLAGGVIDLTGLRWLSAALLAVAALCFLGYALSRIGLRLPRLWRGGESPRLPWPRGLLRPLFAKPVGVRGYGLGLALGFLPCGLLYGAAAAAAAAGSAAAAALAMMAFAAGTVPALFGIGLAGHVVGTRWHGAAARVTPVLLFLNAGLLGFMAWRTVT